MLRAGIAAGLLLLGVSAGAEAPVMPDLGAVEAMMRETGHLPLRGLAPPDPVVARLTWQKMPMAGVPAARRPIRDAIRAERLGEFDAARKAWAAIAADPKASQPDREEALLAAVRLGVTHDPAAARAALAAVPPALRQGTGVRMLEARLLLMDGKYPDAVALLSGEIPAAMRLGRIPAMQLMTELSMAAMLAGDRSFAEQIAGWSGEALASGLLQPALPRCSPEEGLLPGDSAVVDVGLDILGQLSRATPVWASRPGPMAERLAARALDGNSNSAQMDLRSGTPLRILVQLACAPHDIVPDPLMAASAFAELGADGTPRQSEAMRTFLSAPRPTSPEQALARLQDSALPLDVKTQMLAQAVTMMGDRPDSCGFAERLAGAGSALAFESRLALAVALARCKSPEAAASQLKLAADDTTLPEADRRAAAARAAGLTRDPALRARMAAAALLPADSCLLLDDLTLKGLVVEQEDFPIGLRKQSVEGGMLTTFDRAASGATSAVRTMVGQPSLLFDDANRALLKRHTPLPPQRDGRAVACKGHVASIRWQLQEPDQAE